MIATLGGGPGWGGGGEGMAHGPEPLGLFHGHVGALGDGGLAQGHEHGEGRVEHHRHVGGPGGPGGVERLQGHQLQAAARGHGQDGHRCQPPAHAPPARRARSLPAAQPHMAPGQQTQDRPVHQCQVPVVAQEGRGQAHRVAPPDQDPEEVRRGAFHAEGVVADVHGMEEQGDGVHHHEHGELHAGPGAGGRGSHQHQQHPGQVGPGDGAGVEAQAGDEGAQGRVGEERCVGQPEQAPQQTVGHGHQPQAEQQHGERVAGHGARRSARRADGPWAGLCGSGNMHYLRGPFSTDNVT
jgi:hypothetical protein